MDFIDACEQRWQKAQAGEITVTQQAWLTWAREIAKGMSPFESGYPDAAKDGSLDPAAVPLGGPYPPNRDFPRPPTMPKIPAASESSSYSSSYAPQAKQQFPFWLKYPKR